MGVWGNPITAEGGVGPDIMSPVKVSTAKHDALTEEMLRLGIYPSRVDRNLGGGAVPVTPDQYGQYAAYAGKVKHGLGDFIASRPMYGGLPDNFRRVAMTGSMGAGSRVARDQFLLTNPELLQADLNARIQKRLGYR